MGAEFLICLHYMKIIVSCMVRRIQCNVVYDQFCCFIVSDIIYLGFECAECRVYISECRMYIFMLQCVYFTSNFRQKLSILK